MSRKKHLDRAKRVSNDEFYTTYDAVHRLLPMFKDQLAGKNVYCNCDNYNQSKIVKYLRNEFKEFKLKSLRATHYSNIQHDIFGTEVAYPKMYLKTSQEVTIEDMVDNGDFRGNTAMHYLKECDILITNPPFSRIRALINRLLRHNKDFLLVCPMNVLKYFPMFDQIKSGRVKCIFEHKPTFTTDVLPNGITHVNALWITTLDYQHPYELPALKPYDASYYVKFANFDALNVNKLKDIPANYYEPMGVPMTYLKYHPNDEFELIEVLTATRGTEGGVRCMSPEHLRLWNLQQNSKVAHGFHGDLYYINKQGRIIFPFARILIKRKKHSTS